MSKKRYTAEEAAELLTADNDADGNDLQSSSEDNLSSIDEDENQSILSNSDSDDTEASLTSIESESEDADELSDNIATDNYYKSRDNAVKWKRNIPSQRGRPSSINLVNANTIGPTQQVPQSFESPLEAVNLTLPDACVDTVLQLVILGVTDLSRKKKSLFLWAYHLSLELIKLPKTQYLIFTTLNFYRISKLHCLVISCCC